MTLTICLTPEKEQVLRDRAAATGQDVTTFVQQIIERELHTAPSLDEILAPFRGQVKASGMTDEELDSFFEELRGEVWREKQSGKGPRQ